MLTSTSKLSQNMSHNAHREAWNGQDCCGWMDRPGRAARRKTAHGKRYANQRQHNTAEEGQWGDDVTKRRQKHWTAILVLFSPERIPQQYQNLRPEKSGNPSDILQMREQNPEKSVGNDGFHPRVQKECHKELEKPLTELLNKPWENQQYRKIGKQPTGLQWVAFQLDRGTERHPTGKCSRTVTIHIHQWPARHHL